MVEFAGITSKSITRNQSDILKCERERPLKYWESEALQNLGLVGDGSIHRMDGYETLRMRLSLSMEANLGRGLIGSPER